MSKFMTLNSLDFIKGLVMAVLSSVIAIVYTSIQAGSLSFDWKAIAMAAISAALAYITKNLLTNSEGQLLKKG